VSEPDTNDGDDHDFYGDDLDEDEFDSFDCAMDLDGQCGKAGSEECDWMCPYQRLGLRAKQKAKEADRE
jgi:hypothetical protein